MSGKRELVLDAAAKKASLHEIVDAAEYLDSDLTQVIARDKDGKTVVVLALANGEDAVALERFLKRLTKKGAR